MNSTKFETPVALFVFNRPDTTRRVFEAISHVRPTRLLLIADGPREDREADVEACQQARQIIGRVDWPCEVFTNFCGKNLGCQERMISGLNWVFSLVEEAIILEDDCLPDSSFFPFCHELLEKYRGDSRVASISGTNLVAKYVRTDASYFFSQLGGNWGWASWRSEWQRYDRYLADWPELKREGCLYEIFCEAKTAAYWTQVFDDMYTNDGRITWDYQWLYTRLKNNSLTVVPRVNLVANIGFGPGATHAVEADPRLTPPVAAMEFPVVHPLSFIPLRNMDRHLQEVFSLPLSERILRKILRVSDNLPRWNACATARTDTMKRLKEAQRHER